MAPSTSQPVHHAHSPPPELPPHVRAVLDRLWSAGYAAYAVGGGVRDWLLGRDPVDWDVATSARREQTAPLFERARIEGAFGTVRVLAPEGVVDVTTFRRDHRYGDHRRPDAVTFTDDVGEDLLRRDFSVNAIAWGRAATEPTADWLDPTGGLDDLRRRLLRAVGEPRARFEEDALRLLRAVRLATELRFEIEEGTLRALEAAADDIGYVSAERVRAELARIVAVDEPSRGLRLLQETGLLRRVLPELDEQLGVEQGKPIGGDLWQHTLATVDAAAALAGSDAVVRWAALLHDVGKPATAADGHFHGHHEVGAGMARDMLARLRAPRHETDLVVRLVRWHMVMYEQRWSDAAIRRFIRKVGVDLLPRLWLLREADNLGSGVDPDAGGLAELRARVEAQLAAGVPLGLGELAVDGHDLLRELGVPSGPIVGTLLGRLLDSVIADPARNRRDILLADARAWLASERAP
jgi:tRNA nucleotidyltransferase (CCA-adding enzyme)